MGTQRAAMGAGQRGLTTILLVSVMVAASVLPAATAQAQQSSELALDAPGNESQAANQTHEQPTSRSNEPLGRSAETTSADRPPHTQDVAGSNDDPLSTESPSTEKADPSPVATPSLSGEILTLDTARVAAAVEASAADGGYGPGDPVGVDDFYAVANDEVLTVVSPGFLANDFDLDGGTVSGQTLADDVDNGTLSALTSGAFTYTPDPGFVGTDTFQYTLVDDEGTPGGPVTVTIEVLPAANRAPVGVDDVYGMVADTTLNVTAPGFLGNDVDPDGDTISGQTLADDVDNGTLSALTSGAFTYTPDPGFVGTDTFQYTLVDDEGTPGGPVTVTIHVVAANRAPVGVADTFATPVDTALNITAPGFLGNDVDPDGDTISGQTLADDVDNGTLSALTSGAFTYTPDPGFVGTDTFQYTLVDDEGTPSGPVTVTIHVIDTNRPPVATDDNYTTSEDVTLTVPAPGVLGNDTDPDGDALTVTGTSTPTNGVLNQQPDGSFTYVPAPDFCGTDSYTYTVSDPASATDPATVNIEIVCVNDPPVALDDTFTTDEGSTLTVPAPGVLGNDTDPDGDTLTVSAFDAVSAFGGTVAVAPDGSFSYEPAAGFAGFDSFEYEAADGNGGVDTALVSIEVAATHNRSIGVEVLDLELTTASEVSGAMRITNASSGGLTVQITDLAVLVEQRQPGGGGWIEVAVTAGSCVFTPASPFVVSDAVDVSFVGCALVSPIPPNATVRVTMLAEAFGRISGAGNADGWFSARGSI